MKIFLKVFLRLFLNMKYFPKTHFIQIIYAITLTYIRNFPSESLEKSNFACQCFVYIKMDISQELY